MGLLPEFFILLGLDIFLALGFLSALLDEDTPPLFQYLFEGAAVVGLGLLYMSQVFINASIFGQDPADITRFWFSTVYLASAVSSATGLNIYLAAVRRKPALASTFTGTVTAPTLMISALFVFSFLGNGGEVSFTPATIMMVPAFALLVGLSMFSFLREASKRISNTPSGEGLRSTGPISMPLGMPGTGLPLHPPSSQAGDREEPQERKNARTRKKSLRLGLLLLSTLFIISGSALVYASMVYEKGLDVGNTNGINTGSGSTESEASFTPAAIMMLAVAALVIGLSIFGFVRQASRRLTPHSQVPFQPSVQGEDWDESSEEEEAGA